MIRRVRIACVVGMFAAPAVTAACGGGSSSSPAPPSQPATPLPAIAQPAMVLGRPSETSVVASIKVDPGTEIYLEYGTAPGNYVSRTAAEVGTADRAIVLTLSDLEPEAQYYYRARYRTPSEPDYRTDAEHFFHTKRRPGATFTFVLEADPHLDVNSSPAVFAQTLANELADRPDFLIDLGDTSMAGKCAVDGTNLCAPASPPTQATVAGRYALMRSYFERTCHSVPLFMVLGNHDGETGWVADPAAGSLYEWALSARKALFANPEPDGFYTGNTDPAPGGGLRQDYYAFEWGDALFVMLDPYAYTTPKPGKDSWGWTIGAAQYQWLARTLAASRARFKFVFSHHLLGGDGNDTRGGAAFAPFFEWGGRNLDGTWGFASRRPGWPSPIHQLLVDNKVTAWFHGHDHLYAREQLDGVVYQEVPQPGQARYDNPDPGAGYGYEGTVGVNIFPSSGHLRVTVSPADVRVEYVRSVASADETATRKNGSVVTGYVVR